MLIYGSGRVNSNSPRLYLFYEQSNYPLYLLRPTLHKHLSAIADNAMRLFFDCPKLLNTRAKRR